MSIALMTSVWRLEGLSATQKLVLLSLADNANDQGECYPSIAQIAKRTCLTDRSVRSAIRSLEELGIVGSAARSGTSTVYFLSIPEHLGDAQPRNVVPPRKEIPTRNQIPPTPERASAPPRNVLPPTPERASAKPSLNRQLNRQGTVNKPAEVPDRLWLDFLAIRKAKRAPLTQTALDGIGREAAAAGLSLAGALSMCCERGWQSFRAEWADPSKAAKPARGGRESTSEFNTRTLQAWLEREESGVVDA